MIITILLLIYAVLGLSFILALALAAGAPAPKPDRNAELLQLFLRTELRFKPATWHMDQAA